jgi:hypothetical protein
MGNRDGAYRPQSAPAAGTKRRLDRQANGSAGSSPTRAKRERSVRSTPSRNGSLLKERNSRASTGSLTEHAALQSSRRTPPERLLGRQRHGRRGSASRSPRSCRSRRRPRSARKPCSSALRSPSRPQSACLGAARFARAASHACCVRNLARSVAAWRRRPSAGPRLAGGYCHRRPRGHRSVARRPVGSLTMGLLRSLFGRKRTASRKWLCACRP